MTIRKICTLLLTALCLSIKTKAQNFDLYRLPPFERAVACIKFYEGMHHRKNYPYVGYGHKIRQGEHLPLEMSLHKADSLLRADLAALCTMFRKYGKDSLLLATLAYNVGPYKILGSNIFNKSTLIKKIESGSRDFKSDYMNFCHYKGRIIASIERRRCAELLLLYD